MSDNKASDWANYVNTLILAALGLGGGGAGLIYKDEISSLFVTRAYHDQDVEARQQALIESLDEKLAPIAESAAAGESNSLPPRIQNLLKLRCTHPGEFAEGASLQKLLDRLKDRYEKLNERGYREGECREGAYYNALGVRVE